MPLYDYKCSVCGKEFHEYLSMKESGNDRNCSCGGVGKRVIGLCQWISFVGSCKYDKINNYPPGTSASDYKNCQ